MLPRVIQTIILFVQLHLTMSSGWERVRLRVETIPTMSTISTHILNTSSGEGAANLNVTLYRLNSNNQWIQLSQNATNKDGRISNLVEHSQFTSGIYKLHFDTLSYFGAQNTKCFYPFIEIVFECPKVEHYHVPLLLNPFSYTTYRGT